MDRATRMENESGGLSGYNHGRMRGTVNRVVAFCRVDWRHSNIGARKCPENSNLPQEVWDMVIDHLHDNQTCLAACSLVCRSWLPSSRYHLFRLIRTREDIPGRGVNALSKLLVKPRAWAILFSIRYLRILASDTEVDTEKNFYPGYVKAKKVSAKEVFGLVSQLANLKQLQLRGVILDGRHRAQAASLPKLDILCLDNLICRNGIVKDLLSILRPFSDIQSLELKEFFEDTRRAGGNLEEERALCQASPPQLRVKTLCLLQYTTSQCSLLCDLMRKTLCGRTLERLIVRFKYWQDILAVGALLHTTGQNFHTLSIDISPMALQGRRASEWKALKLASCISLRGLEAWSIGSSNIYAISAAYFDILSTMPTIPLSKIDFNFSVKNIDDLKKNVDWERMEKVLSRFTELELVNVHIHDLHAYDTPRNERQGYCDLVREMLPALVEKRKVALKYRPSVDDGMSNICRRL